MVTGSPKRTDDGTQPTDSARRHTTRRGYLGTLGAVAAAGLAGCAGVFGEETTDESATQETKTTTPKTAATGGKPTAASANATGRRTAGKSPYTRVYRETIDSVVLVEVATPRGEAEGTGFVYDGGHIVTNAHVVGDARSVRVRFSDRAYLDASVVGTDVSSDLAALEAAVPTGVTTLSLHPAQPAIGTRVLAIGNPYGNYGSASAGIVSAVNRSIPAQNGYTIPDAIQTDAAVNPGNSGGPLMDLAGEVLGVVNSGRRGSQNIAFAISAALAERVVPQLIENGEYDHAYLGVALARTTAEAADRASLDRPRGAVVTRVLPDGPSAGTLREGDVVLRLGGRRIESRQQLSSYLALHASPGDTIRVTFIRDGSRKTRKLTLGTRPQNPSVGVVATTTGR